MFYFFTDTSGYIGMEPRLLSFVSISGWVVSLSSERGSPNIKLCASLLSKWALTNLSLPLTLVFLYTFIFLSESFLSLGAVSIDAPSLMV